MNSKLDHDDEMNLMFNDNPDRKPGGIKEMAIAIAILGCVAAFLYLIN